MTATDDVLGSVRKEMEDTVTAMRREMARTRTGRASTALLEGISVDYYGTKTPLNQIAGLTAPEPRLLLIQPYDRSAISDIERALLQSDLGLVPQNDGKLIRVPIPELTEERRRDLVKHLRKVAEEYRVSLRNHRRDANDLLKSLEKDGEITEDDSRRAHDKIQDATKEYSERLDKILKAKEEEVMEV
ncbi:MAG: ribosome recycling factor [Candidatus Binatia bacterium]